MSVMPFKGMLKWAVAKEDHPSSKTKSSTKSLKKRRKQSHHYHYCSILKSGVCLRIENAAAAISSSSTTKKAVLSSMQQSSTTQQATKTTTAINNRERVTENNRSCAKLTSKRSSGGESGSTGANHENNVNNNSRGLQHSVQRSSSSRFRSKTARHWSNSNMGNNLNTIKSAGDNNGQAFSSQSSSLNSPHCTACPSGDNDFTSNNANRHRCNTVNNINNTNNNTSNQNNNKLNHNSNGGDISPTTMNRNNANTNNNALFSVKAAATVTSKERKSRSNPSSPIKNNLRPNKKESSAEENTTGGDIVGGNADSKSLLYMSLDHLPLAIVKQYERMLQESSIAPDEQCTTEDTLKKFTARSSATKHKKVTSVPPSNNTGALDEPSTVNKKNANNNNEKTTSMPTVLLASPVTKTKPYSSIIKQNQAGGNGTTKKPGNSTNQAKKITIISPPKSKSDSENATISPIINNTIIREQHNLINKTESIGKNQKSSKSFPLSTEGSNVSVKEARNRSLQQQHSGTACIGSSTPPKKKSARTKQTSHLPEQTTNNDRCTQTSENYSKPRGRFKVTIVSSPPSVAEVIKINKEKGNKEVETKDASCETEQKLFPLKSILKDCKSSTLPRMRSQSQNVKPKKNIIDITRDDNDPDKNVILNGRSSSFRNVSSGSCKDRDRETYFCSPLSSRKIYHENLHNNIYSTPKESNYKVPRTPSSSSSTSQLLDVTTTTLRQDVTTTLQDHDITDPQFLEEPMPISTPAVSRCAKKLTLKRSEIRKLEKIRNQTEKLNRFLKKYYHDCLPNLPEEEEEQCSPEEKSVHPSVLRTHWIEKKPEETSTGKYLEELHSPQQYKITRQRRNTLPHPNFPTVSAIEEAARVFSTAVTTAGESLNENADSMTSTSSPIINRKCRQDNAIKQRNNKNSSLLSASAYYSDPILSSLPIIIEDSEFLLHQRKPQKEKVQIQKAEDMNHKSNKISTTAPARSTSCSSILINDNNNKIASTSPTSFEITSIPNLNDAFISNESRRSSSVSTSSSTCYSCNGSCCSNTSKCSSTASSIVNLANEFRMAEVIRHDNNIHESFLMSTHNFPLEDNSLLLFTEKEFSGGIGSRCIPTINGDEGGDDEIEQTLEYTKVETNQNCESPSEVEGRTVDMKGGNNIDSFAIASPAYAIGVQEAVLREECRAYSDNNNNDNEDGSKNNRTNICSNKSNNGNKSKDFMIPFASCKNKNTRVGSSSSNNSINSVDEESHDGIIEEEAADHCFGQEKLKGYTTMMMMMGSGCGEVKPLGNSNPFDVPTSAEDEGFMSPYPPEAYSPASTTSNTSILLNRLSISSGKGSAEDYDDERRLELFFLDSSCETSMMAEQQIAAYTQHHEFHPELIHIPGEKSHHQHLISSKQGHGSDTVENLKKKDADEDDDGSINLILNHCSYYQKDQQDESNVTVENADESLDMKDTRQQHLEQESLCIPSQISFREPAPAPRLRPRTSILLENSNYFSTCDEKETWNSHDYATLPGSSSNSSTTSGSSNTSTYAACGSFFPNPNLLKNHHERQLSSDSTSTAAFSLLNECENDHNHHHLHQCHHDDDHHHIYDEVAPSVESKSCGDNDSHIANSNNNDNNEFYDNASQHDDDEEESVIIQSSVGNSTGCSVGIAFSTPIPPRQKQQTFQSIRRLRNNRRNYYRCSNANTNRSFIRKSFLSSSAVSAVSNRSIISLKKHRYSTPKKIVRKPPVKTPFTDKGEVLIRCYRNGEYVTVHVIQVRNLQACYRSSWKLSLKISLVPEGEATFTKSDSVLVPRARKFVRIDQKFSFEIPVKTKSRDHFLIDIRDNCANEASSHSGHTKRKVFLTFVKRIEKRTTFLGWITLDVPEKEKTFQCWQKLRKRKMSSASYSAHSSTTANHHFHNQSMPQAATIGSGSRQIISGITSPFPGGVSSTCTEAMVGLPSHIETLEQGVVVPSVPSRSCKSPEFYHQEYLGKSQLQNSSTMDSGVEDCCEPPTVPCVELDEKLGFRVRVHMAKPEGAGFGFSVVWVSPPRIERLEKDRTAELAGLKIGDLIIGVNGEDVTNVANTIIYNKMKSTGAELHLEIWRKHPHVPSSLHPHLTSVNVPQPINPTGCIPPHGLASSVEVSPLPPKPIADHQPTNTAMPQRSSYNSHNIKSSTGLPGSSSSTTNGNMVGGSNNHIVNRIQSQPPTSILKPPPPAPPASSQIAGNSCPSQSQQNTTGASAWRIRFNIELLDNEDDNLKQFFICELKFFRKVVAALDRYLIPAQANRLLTPQEIHSIFAQVIKIITMTKRILQCVANGSNSSSWKLGRILLSTHSDHLPDITSAYKAYARSLGSSATILSEKMGIQNFAKFVLETPVPKGHLDMTSLLFAPFEHLRNLCEIGEEICHQHENWAVLNSRLKECYADIVCETDFMEPISHISMKKNPLVSVRDLEKRIISTTSQQPLKVCEKGRKWLFGSRLYRRENDGSWSPVWAFLFTDIIVLTSHMTRDRVFFVKESPIRLDDVTTLHFNLPKKHENEFRLLFGPDNSQHSRLDRILPLVRSKKSNQVVLRTANIQLKSLWKLLLQRQIISLNTRLSKSSSSNFSISEFCEKFPVVQHDSIMEEDEEKGEVETAVNVKKSNQEFLSPIPSKMTQHSIEPHSQKSPSTNLRAAKPQIDQTQVQIQKLKEATKPMVSIRNDSPAVTRSMTKNLQNQSLTSGTEVKIKHQTVEKTVNEVQRETTISTATTTPPAPKPYVPDGFSSLNRDLLRSRVTRPGGDRRPSIPTSDANVTTKILSNTGHDIDDRVQVTPSSAAPPAVSMNADKISNRPENSIIKEVFVKQSNHSDQILSNERNELKDSKPSQHDMATNTDNLFSNNNTVVGIIPPVPKARTSLHNSALLNANSNITPNISTAHRTSTPAPESCSPSPIPSHNNNNNTIENVNTEKKSSSGKCPCEKIQESGQLEGTSTPVAARRDLQQPTAYPSPKPRQLSNLRKLSTKNEPTQSSPSHTNNNVSNGNANETNTANNKQLNSVAKPPILKERDFGQPEILQSPIMVKRALAMASGSGSPSSVSSLSPARRPYVANKGNDVAIVEGGVNNGALKSKPGSKIMTNAILKSRQQELMIQNLQTASVSTETLRTEKSSDTTASTSKTDSSTQYFSLKEESTTTSSCSNRSQSEQLPERCIYSKLVHHQHHSHHCPAGCSGTSTVVRLDTIQPHSPHLSVPPRCHSENSHHPKKSKPVHTDSPIISGYGSERTRRRMLVDNKLRKDYPELFGITPKDRRTFIKQLGDEEISSEVLVAPYYYTLSPVPLPKNAIKTMGSSNNGGSLRSNMKRQGNAIDNVESNPYVIPPFNSNNTKNGEGQRVAKSSSITATSSTMTMGKHEIPGSTNKFTTNKPPKLDCNVLNSSCQTVKEHIGESSRESHVQQTRNNTFPGFPGPARLSTSNETSNSLTSTSKDCIQEEKESYNDEDNDDEMSVGGFSAHLGHDVFQASLELDEDGERLKAFVEKMREDMNVGSDEEDEENDEEEEDETEASDSDSDDSTAGGQEEEPGQSHRSHEESSNDSGISDEMTEKSKTTVSGLMEEDERSLSLSISRRNENFSNMLDRMRSGVVAAEVKIPDKISSNTNTSAVSNSTTPVANSNTSHVLIHDLSVKTPVVDDVGNNVLVVDNNNCFSLNNTVDHTNKTQCVDEGTLCFLEGETKASVATMVVLKVDKATETEEDDFNFLLTLNNLHECNPTPLSNNQPQKPIRSLLAERREAFFLSNQSSCPNSHHPFPGAMSDGFSTFAHQKVSTLAHSQQHCGSCSSNSRGTMLSGGISGISGGGCLNCIPHEDASHPLRVKILDGDPVQSVVEGTCKTEPESSLQLCERVQLQRLERQKRAKVERVESSEDSTSSSSDLASASPAAENGTTDPSWSSSSSSLAGYGSSKEDSMTNNNTTASSTVAPAVSVSSNKVSTSSSSLCTSASTSVSAIVASSACSLCSNTNNNPACNNYNVNYNKNKSVSSGISCSISAQTHNEPSSSCNESTSSYSLEGETDLKNNLKSRQTNFCGSNDTAAIQSNIRNTSSNNQTYSNGHVASFTCSHRQAKSFPSSDNNNIPNCNSETNQNCENNSEVDSSTSCSSISTTSNSKESKMKSDMLGESSVNNIYDDDGSNDNEDEGDNDFGRVKAMTGPEIVVTQESDAEDSSHSSNENGNTRHGYSSDGEEDSIVCNGKAVDSVASDGGGSSASAGDGGGSGCSSGNRSIKGFLRVESNDSTAENYGDDDDYNFDDDDEDDLSHCSVATINRYGTFESLEKLESEDTVGGLPDFPRTMPRSKARFTFEDDDDDDDDLFEEDFETDFNFRFPSQIQDNTYSVSRLGPLPPLLEEDYEDEMYDEQRASGTSPSGSSGTGEYSGGVGTASGSNNASLRARHEVSSVAIQRINYGSRPSSNVRIHIPYNSQPLPIPASSLNLASGLQATPVPLLPSLSPRAQKLVIVKSSEAEMIVFSDASGRSTSEPPSQLSSEKTDDMANKVFHCSSSSLSENRSFQSIKVTPTPLPFNKDPSIDVTTNTSI